MELKIVHLPQNIGNNVLPLSLALRSKGLKSDCLVYRPHSFGYGYDFVVHNPKYRSRIFGEVAKIYWLIRIIRNYNTVHFNFGTTLAGRVPPSVDMGMLKKTARLPYRLYLNLFQAVELRLFRLFRIKMFVHYQGDDARQGSQMQGLEYSLLQGVQKGYYSDKSDQFKASQIERISKFTDKVFYVNPDLSRVLPRNSVFIPYSHVDLGKFEFVKKDLKHKKIRIVHAPSNRGAKGTNYVLETMLKIQLSHPEISFELVENLPHERALEIYRDADLVIDQLLAGWYGGLAVEALAIGVPVMCYLREDDFNKVDPKMIDELPIINVTQSTLEEKILDFIAMSDLEIEALRRAGRIYVEKWHSIDEISEEILNYYYEAHKSNQ